MSFYKLTVEDSLVLRDNRFGQGSIMRSLEWVTPSVMAGSVRTAVGKARTPKGEQIVWNHDELRKVSVAGPFPVCQGEIGFFPPADMVVQKGNDDRFHVYPLLPKLLSDSEGVDLPKGLLPCCMPTDALDGKPSTLKGFWSLARMKKWLLGSYDAEASQLDELSDFPMPVLEQSTHVKIDAKSKTAEDGKLFTCSSLSFTSVPYDLSVQIGTDELKDGTIHPVGGERHLVHWNKTNAPAGWECPAEIRQALATSKQIRMVLTSSAIFAQGWLPDWIEANTLEGIVPGTNVKVVLKSAAIQRWRAISGWSYEDKGPKPIRRITPTGSVYFFEVVEGNAQELAMAWMKSVCLDKQDVNDGFGLAVWGTWKEV